MSRNIIFGGVLVAVVAVMAISSLLRDDDDQGGDGWGMKISVSDDDIVIEENTVRSGDKKVDCRKNGGTVTITRANGQEVTITCD